jgi:hypothetical protein
MAIIASWVEDAFLGDYVHHKKVLAKFRLSAAKVASKKGFTIVSKLEAVDLKRIADSAIKKFGNK